VHAVDRAGNESHGAAFSVVVDRTPPTGVTDVSAEFDSDSNETGWSEAVDPDLKFDHLLGTVGIHCADSGARRTDDRSARVWRMLRTTERIEIVVQ
jgi:hypothetical protein